MKELAAKAANALIHIVLELSQNILATHKRKEYIFCSFHDENVYYIKMNYYLLSKVWSFFPEISAKIFFWKLAYLVPRCIQKTSPTLKHETSSLSRSDLSLSSKSMKCFLMGVFEILHPSVYQNANDFMLKIFAKLAILQRNDIRFLGIQFIILPFCS